MFLVELLVAIKRIERLMQVEGFDMQHPVVMRRILVDEIETGLEGARLGLVFLDIHEATVDPVLPGQIAQPVHRGIALFGEDLAIRLEHLGVRINAVFAECPFGDIRLVQVTNPGVAFLPTPILPGGVMGVVVQPAIFKIVVMIGGQMGVDARLAKDFRHAVIKRLQRA